MTGEVFRDAVRALEEHDAFERVREEEDEAARAVFAQQTTPFDGTVYLQPAGGVVAYQVTVRVPSLDSMVRGETVAPVVSEGWLDTFALRLEDVGGAVRSDPEPPLVRRDAAEDAVVVETAFETDIAARGADDAKAVVDYVEGTYVEGIVPGYDYREPVAGLLDRAIGNAVDR